MKPKINKLSSEAVTVREMVFQDLLTVFQLGEKLFTAEKWPTLYRTWDEYTVINTFVSDGDFCLVAEYKSEIIGFAIGSLIDKRRSAWVYGYLEWIGVAPEVKGLGVGQMLLQYMTGLFIDSGARMIMVDTEEANTGALNFFRGNGFDQENKHIYLTRNLSQDPQYLKLRKAKTKRKNKIKKKNPSKKIRKKKKNR